MLPLTASGSFKIATDKDGDYSQKFFFRDAKNSGLISEDATGDRQWSVGEDGYYKVAVDLKDGSIYINKVTANMLKGYSELNDATTIGRIDAAVSEDNSYYTLSGVKVQKPTRGIYIVGGRKVIVK